MGYLFHKSNPRKANRKPKSISIDSYPILCKDQQASDRKTETLKILKFYTPA